MSKLSHTNQSSTRWLNMGLLLLILLSGFVLRVWHVDWADGQLPHPDERSTVAFYAPSIHLPPEGVDWLDKRRSPLNPLWNVERQERRSYTYGHFPLYLLVLTADIVDKLAPLAEKLGAGPELVRALDRANGVPGYAIVGRILMALADTLTVFLVYLLAARIYGRRKNSEFRVQNAESEPESQNVAVDVSGSEIQSSQFTIDNSQLTINWVGLLAAALSAFSVLQIQLSHFFAVDPISTTFTVLALYGALRMVEDRSWGWAALTGLAAGLAIASKFSALPILAAPVVAGLLMVWPRLACINNSELTIHNSPLTPSRAAALVLFALLIALISFAVTSPFAILDWDNFNRAVLVEQGAMVRGDADFPFTRQYRGTAPYLYQIIQQSRWGLGWPLGILAFGGLAWAVLKFLRGRASAGEWIILSWIVPYFGLTGLFLAKFMRYMVPVTPLLVVLGVGIIAALAVRSEKLRITHYELRIKQIALIFATVVFLSSAFWSLAYVNGVYNNTHPWIKASRWMYAREGVPDGSVIAWEQWDDSLPYGLPEPNSDRSRYRTIDWGPFEEDTAQKFEILKKTLREADYISLSSNRIYGAVDNLPERYPMTNRYYDLLFSGELGYELALKETNHPRLFGFDINDEKADESFTLYDHPTVLVFRKVRDLSDAEWEALLGGSWEGAKAWDVGEPILLSRIMSLLKDETKPPREAGPGEGPDLLLNQPLDELPGVQDFRWNGIASRSTLLAVLVWWLALALLGLAAWPIAFVLFDNLRDRGYLLARSLGWLLVGYIVWLAASLRVGRNALWMIWLALLLVAGLSLWLWRRNRAEMSIFLRSHRPLLLFSELLFAAAFIFFVVLRIFNPDIWQPWQGGEKFMEFAFLNAILRSPNFPPIDPYFAGGTINYYYYGQYLVALLAKLTGIWSSVVFNLAIPTLFALTVANVFSLGYNLAGRFTSNAGRPRRRWQRPRWLWHGVDGGLLAAFFVAVLGNVDGGGQVVRALAARSDSHFTSNLPGLQTALRAFDGLLTPGHLPAYRYWDPSRVLPYTINEFPYWSFLFADLHPHMIGIPFTVLFLALAYNLLAGGRLGQSPLSGLGRLLVMAVVLGALAVINTWDLPTYFGLAVLVWLAIEWRSGRLATMTGRAFLRTGLFAAALLLLSIGAYLPFFRHYVPIAASGVGIVKLKDEPGLWLNIWGFFGFLAVTYLAVELRREPASRRLRDPRFIRQLRLGLNRWPNLPRLLRFGRSQAADADAGAASGLATLLILGLALAAGLWLLDFRVPALLVLPLLAAAVLLLRRGASPENLFLSALVFTGLLVLLGVEFVYLKDHLQGGEFKRMNTLFKFYVQVWVMLGLAGAVALPRAWAFIRERWSLGWKLAWMVSFAWLLALSLVFPLIGTPARLDDRFPPQNGRPPIGTLDGMAYMEAGMYTWHINPDLAPSTPIVLRHDYEAIHWLLDNVKGTPVVAEALLDYYRAGGLRVASFTGFPTLLGFHQEGEQRYGWQTGERRGKAEEFWNTTDPARAMQLIDELGINLIYVGKLERIVTSPDSLAKFDSLAGTGALEIIYRNEEVVIYRVV